MSNDTFDSDIDFIEGLAKKYTQQEAPPPRNKRERKVMINALLFGMVLALAIERGIAFANDHAQLAQENRLLKQQLKETTHTGWQQTGIDLYEPLPSLSTCKPDQRTPTQPF